MQPFQRQLVLILLHSAARNFILINLFHVALSLFFSKISNTKIINVRAVPVSLRTTTFALIEFPTTTVVWKVMLLAKSFPHLNQQPNYLPGSNFLLLRVSPLLEKPKQGRLPHCIHWACQKVYRILVIIAAFIIVTLCSLMTGVSSWLGSGPQHVPAQQNLQHGLANYISAQAASNSFDIVVVGSGLSGLTAAYRLVNVSLNSSAR